MEPIPPQGSLLSSSSDVATSSRCTKNVSDSIPARQSRRRRVGSELGHLEEHGVELVNPMTSFVGGVGSLRQSNDAASSARLSKRRIDIQEVPALRLRQQVRPGIEEHRIPREMKTLPPANNCTKCGALKLAFETPTFCCSKGQVHLIQNELPSELFDLYGGTDENALHFQKMQECTTTPSLSAL